MSYYDDLLARIISPNLRYTLLRPSKHIDRLFIGYWNSGILIPTAGFQLFDRTTFKDAINFDESWRSMENQAAVKREDNPCRLLGPE